LCLVVDNPARFGLLGVWVHSPTWANYSSCNLPASYHVALPPQFFVVGQLYVISFWNKEL